MYSTLHRPPKPAILKTKFLLNILQIGLVFLLLSYAFNLNLRYNQEKSLYDLKVLSSQLMQVNAPKQIVSTSSKSEHTQKDLIKANTGTLTNTSETKANDIHLRKLQNEINALSILNQEIENLNQDISSNHYNSYRRKSLNAINTISSHIKKSNPSNQLLISLLMLRQHEQNFLLRKNDDSLIQLQNEVEHFKSLIAKKDFRKTLHNQLLLNLAIYAENLNLIYLHQNNLSQKIRERDALYNSLLVHFNQETQVVPTKQSLITLCPTTDAFFISAFILLFALISSFLFPKLQVISVINCKIKQTISALLHTPPLWFSTHAKQYELLRFENSIKHYFLQINLNLEKISLYLQANLNTPEDTDQAQIHNEETKAQDSAATQISNNILDINVELNDLNNQAYRLHLLTLSTLTELQSTNKAIHHSLQQQPQLKQLLYKSKQLLA